MTRSRRGFTIVELLIVAVLGSLVVGAAYQVLVTNQRTYTAQNAQIQSQQTVRAGMDVLFGELRELSRTGLDIQAFGTDTLKVRAMRKFGLACAVNIGAGYMDVIKYGSWVEIGDSVVMYAENTMSTAADDDWIKGRVTARDTTLTCSGKQAQRLFIPAITSAAAGGSPDTIRAGTNIRTFTHYTYGLYTVDGAPYLGRRDAGSTTTTALVGPLKSSTGLAFRYLDTLNAVTTTLANVAQIEVTLRTSSTIRGPQGGYVADSIKTRISLRN
jgi:prepilin-type N-terminal cleavage/methylation domain-containing protein